MSDELEKILNEPLSTREDLLNHLKEGSHVFKNARIEAAFNAIDRKDFVEPDYIVEAYEDYPIPIGNDQTISQPTTVAFMLELLDVQEGDSVLDVGCGSGFSTALLAHITDSSGHVYATDRIEEFVEKTKQRLGKYELHWTTVVHTPKSIGCSEGAPYQRILVSAAAKDSIPEELTDMLAINGAMVIPVENSIIKVVKVSDTEYEKKEFPGFSFVPLIEHEQTEE